MPEPDDTGDYTEHFEALEKSCRFFQQNLQGNKVALDYLTKVRGLRPETIEEFQLGYAPDSWNALLNHLMDFNTNVLVETGLVSERHENLHDNFKVATKPKVIGHYDYFRSRLMFPLFNQKGMVIGFGGRTMDHKELLKYRNSLETPLFQKRSFLYGLSHTAQHIAAQKQAIVVEGYFDMLRSYQEGVRNIAATLGTAMTSEHFDELERVAGRGLEILFCFDGDEAGIQTTLREIQAGITRTKSYLRVCPISLEDKDPAHIYESGKDFRDTIKLSVTGFNFLLDESIKKTDLTSVTKAGNFLLKICRFITTVPKKRRAPYILALKRKTHGSLIGREAIEAALEEVSG